MTGKTPGHYQITERLGKGGMGDAANTPNPHLVRDVATKTFPPEGEVAPAWFLEVTRDGQ